jgi:hypothetical protein
LISDHLTVPGIVGGEDGAYRRLPDWISYVHNDVNSRLKGLENDLEAQARDLREEAVTQGDELIQLLTKERELKMETLQQELQDQIDLNHQE